MTHDRTHPPAGADAGVGGLGPLAAPLLDAVASPLYVKDAGRRYVLVNDALCRLLGVERGRLLGRTDHELLPREQACAAGERDRAVLASGEPDCGCERLRTAGGERSVVTRRSRLVGADGARYVVGILEDVTERESSEERLRRAYAFMESLLDAVPMPVFVRDRDRRYRFVNRAFCRFMGKAREELLGASYDATYPDPVRRERVRGRDDEVFAGHGPQVHDVVVPDAAGQERHVRTHRALFEDERGEPVMVGAFADITELEQARESMRIAAQVFEHTAEGIVVADSDLKVVSVNHAFERITGFGEQEVIGEDATTLLDGTQLGDTLGEAVRRALREHGQWQGEVTGRRRSGEIYPAWATVSVVHDSGDAARRYIAIFSDVTERKASEERVQWLAHHDLLTGLANRSQLMDRAQSAFRRARRYGHRAALMAVDLDRFKAVNDRLGHLVGDQVLVQAAARMREAVRATDTVARTGGDEFAVLLADPKEHADADAVALKLVERLSRPFTVDGREIRIGASIGIAVFPEHGEDLPTLLGVADRSLYRAKKQGRGGVARHGARVQHCNPDDQAPAPGRGSPPPR